MIFYLLKLVVNLEDQRNNDLLLKKGDGRRGEGIKGGCNTAHCAGLLVIQREPVQALRIR